MTSKFRTVMGNKLPPGSFISNVVTLMTGTTFAQAIPIAISPILTRIYSPEDFGVLALFVAITAIFGSVANGRYELAIVLPVEDEDAINVTVLCVIIATVVSIILFVIAVIFNDAIVTRLGNSSIAPWLYFVPLVVFLTGLFNALNYFHVRTKGFKDIAKATVNKSVASAATQLGLGFLKTGSTGLIVGQIVSFITGNSILAANILKKKKLLSSINKSEIKRLAKRYIDFPKFSMWSILANTLSYNIVSIFISSIFGATTLGFYSLGNKVLGAPASLVGNSIGQVFFQRVTEEKQKHGSATEVFIKASKALLLVGLPPFVLLFFILEDLFAFVFGSEWRIAGAYAKIMLPLFCVRFFTAPLSIINSVFEKQKISLIWQLSLLLMSIIIMFLSYLYSFDIKVFLGSFAIASIALYLVLWIILLQVSKGKI